MYYKVVRKSYDNTLLSVFKTDIEVEYKIGRFVEPSLKGTPLLVFSTMADAISFRDKWNWQISLEVYECDVIKPRKALNYRSNINPSIMNNLRAWWADIFSKRKAKKSAQIGYDFPSGSMFCSSVKLTKKVG